MLLLAGAVCSWPVLLYVLRVLLAVEIIYRRRRVMKILLVEDDTEISAMPKRFSKTENYEITTCFESAVFLQHY